jgi:hypothetical protein
MVRPRPAMVLWEVSLVLEDLSFFLIEKIINQKLFLIIIKRKKKKRLPFCMGRVTQSDLISLPSFLM